MPARISIDFETRGALDLEKVGAFRYSVDRRTIVLAVCWQGPQDAEPLRWNVLHEDMPAAFEEAVRRVHAGEAVFSAWNAQFEQAIYGNTLRRMYPGLPSLPPERWVCSMAEALTRGLPGSLEHAAKWTALDQTKDEEGARLMKVLSSASTRLDHAALPRLLDYCAQDVRTERALAARVGGLTSRERRIWELDQRMNWRGVRIDVEGARHVLAVVQETQRQAKQRLSDRTAGRVETPNQRDRLLSELARCGIWLPDLRAGTVERWLDRDDLPEEARYLLEVRAEAGGTAVTKLKRMLEVADPHDQRARGLLQYYGATATGRWAGRLVQPQNLPRPKLQVKDRDAFIALFARGADAVREQWGNPLVAASDALRMLITAAPGSLFVTADLSAIEARIVLWLAGHEDAMRIFRSGGDIYCEQASALYGRPITKADKAERQIGKVIVLGCGYQMGPDKFRTTAAAAGILLSHEEAQAAVRSYRTRWHQVPRLWYGVEDAVRSAVRTGRPHSFGRLDFGMKEGTLLCRLPSGRVLHWPGATLVDYGGDRPSIEVAHWRGGSMTRAALFGGMIVERATQATARDVLAEGLLRAEAAGLNPVLTVHDEVCCDTNRPDAVDALVACMSEPPTWAPDLPLVAEGDAEFRYGK